MKFIPDAIPKRTSLYSFLNYSINIMVLLGMMNITCLSNLSYIFGYIIEVVCDEATISYISPILDSPTNNEESLVLPIVYYGGRYWT